MVSQNARHRGLLVLKWLIFITVAFFIWRSFASARVELSAHPELTLREVSLPYLFGASLLYLAAMLPMAIYFHVLNRAFGQNCSLANSVRAHLIGHLGKYVPGKAMVVVLRTGLLRGVEIQPAVVAIAVFIETFTMLAVGAALSGCLIVWLFPQQSALVWLSALLFVGAVSPTWPPLLKWVIRRFKSKSWSNAIGEALEGYTTKVMAIGWILELFALLLMSLSLWAVLRAIPMTMDWTLQEHFGRLAASTSLSMVAGFASLIPGGLGVRELVLDQLLKQPFGQLVAFAAPIGLRLIWLLTELVVSAILYLVGPTRGSEA